MSKFYRIKIDEFSRFFDEKLKQKYEPQGLKGIRLRFQALMNCFLDSCKITIELHSVIENRIKILEYIKQDKRLDQNQVEVQKQKII
jgi:hypothetical protein